MKKLSLLALFTSSVLSAYSEGVFLSTGDSWTYGFTNLEYLRTTTGSLITGGYFDFTYKVADGANMTFELFEDVDLPAVPFQSWSLPFGGTNNFGVLLPVGAWQDLNGSVRFGVTDGSVLIDSLTFVVSRYEVGSQTQIEVFKTVVSPIPEPTVLVFLVVGAFTCLPRTTWSTRQRIEMTGAQRSVIPIRG